MKVIALKYFRNPIDTAYSSNFSKLDTRFPYALLKKQTKFEGMIELDILIRDVDATYVKEIEKKAEQISTNLGRFFSRNEYIKMLIQNDVELKLAKLKQDKFDQAVDNLTITLRNQERTLQNFIDSNSRLYHMLASGVDILEEVLEDDK